MTCDLPAMHPFACACEVFDLEAVTKLREQIDELEASALEAREEIDRLTRRGDEHDREEERLQEVIEQREDELAELRRRECDPEEVAEAMVRETTSGRLSWITDPIEREAWLDRARAAISVMSDASERDEPRKKKS